MHPFRTLSLRAVAASAVALQLCYGASTLLAADHDHNAMLDAATATITTGELHEYAGTLADDSFEGREAGTRGGHAAARYVEEQLRATKLLPAGAGGQYAQPFGAGYENLLAKLPGADPQLSGEYVLLGAHYDHVGYGTWKDSYGPIGYIHNGADDNASGVSTVLEVLDALSRTGWQPRRTLIFAFWDGEEKDLLGSKYWVKHPTIDRLSDVKLAINIDMVGRMREGRLEVGGTRTGYGLRQQLSTTRLPDDMWLDFSWDYKPNSDHWPFFEAGVPSVLMHTGLHPDYHRPTDDIEKLNLSGMQKAAAYVLEMLTKLADADELPKFRAASRGEDPKVQAERELPAAESPPRLAAAGTWSMTAGQGAVKIDRVTPGSTAEKAGLRVGDRVAAVDDVPLSSESILPAEVLRAEGEVRLNIIRNDQPPQTIRIPLEGTPVQLGLSWREDDATPGTVYVTRVVPFSPAARAGIKTLDRVDSVDGEPFANQDALLAKIRERLAAGDQSLQIEVEHAGRLRTIVVNTGLPTQTGVDSSL